MTKLPAAILWSQLSSWALCIRRGERAGWLWGCGAPGAEEDPPAGRPADRLVALWGHLGLRAPPAPWSSGSVQCGAFHFPVSWKSCGAPGAHVEPPGVSSVDGRSLRLYPPPCNEVLRRLHICPDDLSFIADGTYFLHSLLPSSR